MRRQGIGQQRRTRTEKKANGAVPWEVCRESFHPPVFAPPLSPSEPTRFEELNSIRHCLLLEGKNLSLGKW